MKPASEGSVEVGQLIALVAKAYGTNTAQVVDEIARMAAHPSGEDSDPTRETILSYVKEPKMVSAEQRGTRRNRLTPVHHRFAHLVLNYLDGRRAGGESVPVPIELSETEEWRYARRICKHVLQQERDRRFERSLGHDPGVRMTIEKLCGVYAVCRQESSDGSYRQELLVLNNDGTSKLPRCHCTFVSLNVVGRGGWLLAGNTIYCDISGMRDDNSHEIGGLYLAHHAQLDSDLLSGFLAGSGTGGGIPVAMPVVAVKIPDASKAVRTIGELGDEAIMRAFRSVKSNLGEVQDQLKQILDAQMPPTLFQATTVHPLIRRAFSGGQALIDPQFHQFCRSTIY